MIYRSIFVFLGLVLAVSGTSLFAQDLSYRVAAGAAMPSGTAGESRNLGPATTLSVALALSPYFSVRFDTEFSLLDGLPVPPGQPSNFDYGDMRTFGASLNGIVRLFEDRYSTYVLGGIGAYRLQHLGGRPNPYGTTVAVQFGIGVDTNLWDRFNPFIEARAQAHVTDYGAEEFSTFTTIWPVMVGVRIR